MGPEGHLVLPSGLRERQNWTEGTLLVAIETDGGVLLSERAELEERVRQQLGGHDVVGSLLADRREEARNESDASRYGAGAVSDFTEKVPAVNLPSQDLGTATVDIADNATVRDTLDRLRPTAPADLL